MPKNKESSKQSNRRQFLRGAGTGALMLGSGAVLAGTSEKCEPGSNRKFPAYDYDAIVIGGGYGGATAARDLQENGFKTVILEARNRLGGRTFTSEFEGHKVELGGTWIHWSQPFVWAEKERYDLPVVETPGGAADTMIIRVDGKPIIPTEAQLGEILAAFEQITADARRVWERPFDSNHSWEIIEKMDDVTVDQALAGMNLTPLQATVLEGLVAGAAMRSASESSYIEFLRWWQLSGSSLFGFSDATMRYKLKDGTISLINAMIEDGQPEVRLSFAVKRVEDLGDHVRITTTRGDTITAAAVVVTVPMNVMDDIEFSPALPGAMVKAARERHAASRFFKVYMKVKGKQGNLFTLTDSNHVFTTVLTYAEEDDYTLLAAFGNADRVDMYDDEALQEALRDYLPEAEIESSFAYDWIMDPYSQGGHGVYRPGWFKKYHREFAQDAGRIYIAISDYGEGWRGFMDAAVGAGAKAAERINKQFG
jgi:monoamine oxidase